MDYTINIFFVGMLEFPRLVVSLPYSSLSKALGMFNDIQLEKGCSVQLLEGDDQVAYKEKAI